MYAPPRSCRTKEDMEGASWTRWPLLHEEAHAGKDWTGDTVVGDRHVPEGSMREEQMQRPESPK